MEISKEYVERKLIKLYNLYSIEPEEVGERKVKAIVNNYYSLLKSFTFNVIEKSIYNWEYSEKKRFPSPIEIKKKCEETTRFLDSIKSYRLHDLICEHREYFLRKSFLQSKKEASLCMQPSVEFLQEQIHRAGEGMGAQMEFDSLKKHAEMSTRDYGKVLCPWHQSLARARHRPGDIEDIQCQDWVKRIMD